MSPIECDRTHEQLAVRGDIKLVVVARQVWVLTCKVLLALDQPHVLAGDGEETKNDEAVDQEG